MTEWTDISACFFFLSFKLVFVTGMQFFLFFSKRKKFHVLSPILTSKRIKFWYTLLGNKNKLAEVQQILGPHVDLHNVKLDCRFLLLLIYS